ncbi:MAG: FKBP-type peptidyl-prolyl cis-trans isomerase [Chloroflexi bacterium]|nr:FKBP-type peptidyl-prolyl cis-trans isomerase [Chloroflexota bacterium]
MFRASFLIVSLILVAGCSGSAAAPTPAAPAKQAAPVPAAQPTSQPASSPAAPASASPAAKPAVSASPTGGAGGASVKTPSGLEYEDVVVGTGEEARAGRTVSVHYTGRLTNGTKFDSSVDRGQPFEFPLGAGRVIRGWDEGVAGMKVGGKRKLTIPPDLGYGARGAGNVIPPNATLVFDVELLAVR